MKSVRPFPVIAGLLVSLTSVQGAQPSFRVEKIVHPGPFQKGGVAEAITSSGDIVGVYGSQVGSGSKGTSFTIIGGIYTSLTSPGPVPAYPHIQEFPMATGMNDADVIIGYTRHDPRGFIYRNGSYEFLSPFEGKTWAKPLAINSRGDVIGYSGYGERYPNAFLYSDGNMRKIEVGDGLYTRAVDIDDNGRVLVTAFRSEVFAGSYIYESGTVTPFGSYQTMKFNSAGEIAAASGNQLTIFSQAGEGQVFTAADFRSISVVGFNALGQVIGTYNAPDSFDTFYFFFEDGVFYDFEDLLDADYMNLSIRDINDSGEIVGFVTREYPYVVAARFLAVPEPGVVALLLSATSLFAIGTVSRRRR